MTFAWESWLLEARVPNKAAAKIAQAMVSQDFHADDIKLFDERLLLSVGVKKEDIINSKRILAYAKTWSEAQAKQRQASKTPAKKKAAGKRMVGESHSRENTKSDSSQVLLTLAMACDGLNDGKSTQRKTRSPTAVTPKLDPPSLDALSSAPVATFTGSSQIFLQQPNTAAKHASICAPVIPSCHSIAPNLATAPDLFVPYGHGFVGLLPPRADVPLECPLPDAHHQATSNRRKKHNDGETRRRKRLKEQFGDLKTLINSPNDTKPAILKDATDYIKAVVAELEMYRKAERVKQHGVSLARSYQEQQHPTLLINHYQSAATPATNNQHSAASTVRVAK